MQLTFIHVDKVGSSLPLNVTVSSIWGERLAVIFSTWHRIMRTSWKRKISILFFNRPKQWFNASETGLYWECLPQTTLVMVYKKQASGFTEVMDQVTVLLCASATYYKRVPLVIGNRAYHRPFKYIKSLPVTYKTVKMLGWGKISFRNGVIILLNVKWKTVFGMWVYQKIAKSS